MPVGTVVFILLFGLVCVSAFLLGLRFYRIADAPEGASIDQVKRFGRLLMMASVAMLLFLAAVIIHGDLGAVRAGKAFQ